MQKAGLNEWAKFNGAVCKDIHLWPSNKRCCCTGGNDCLRGGHGGDFQKGQES